MFLFVSTAPAIAGSTSVLGGNAELTGLHRATLDSNGANAAAFSSSSASAVLDWAKFNVGAGQSMSFNGAGTTFFNLVDGAAGKSQIGGIINGSGNVWVINPAGIAFGASSSVNVGGLFAAAAGNVENAAALRAGTATLPEFSSFAGSVDASKGTFTADQVALMGRAVKAAGGDFAGTKDLSIGAAGEMTVDEVEGGKVSVNLDAFVEKTDDELNLGALDIGGDLRVVTDGKLRADGAIRAGNVYVKSGGDMALNADVSANNGSISAITYDGDIVVGKKATLKTTADDSYVLLQSAQNQYQIDPADLSIYTAKGDIDVNGSIQAEGAGSSVYVYSAKGDGASGDISIRGTVTASTAAEDTAAGMVQIIAGLGDVASVGNVSIDGSVRTDGETMIYAVGVGDGNDVSIGGSVQSEGRSRVYADYGTVSVDGELSAGTSVYVQNSSGDVSVKGALKGGSDVTVWTGDGSIAVREGGLVEVRGTGAKVDLTTCLDAGATGDVLVEGTVRTGANGGTVNLEAGYADGTVGRVLVGKTGGIEAANASAVRLTGSSGVVAEGSVDASGAMLIVNGEAGDATLDGKISASSVSLSAKGGVSAANPDNEINWLLKTDGSSVAVLNSKEMTVGDVLATKGNVTLGTMSGDLTVAGEVGTTAADGTVTVVSALKDGAAGDVQVTSGGSLSASGAGGMVLASAGCGEGSTGALNVRGTVAADAAVSLSGANGAAASGEVDVRHGDLYVAGHAGNVELNAKGESTVKAGNVDLRSDESITFNATGSEISGELIAEGNDVRIINPGDTVIGDVVAPNGFEVGQNSGSIYMNGVVLAKDFLRIFTGMGDVVVGSDANLLAVGAGSYLELVGDRVKVDGTLTADVVNMVGRQDVRIGTGAKITATGYDADYGSVSVTAQSGRIDIRKGATIAATDPNAQVYLGTFTGDPTRGGIVMNGEIEACTKDHSGNGLVHLSALNGDIDINGNVRVDGMASAMVGKINYALDGNGNPISDGNGGYVKAGTEGDGSIRVNGSVSSVGTPENAIVMVETVNQGDVEVTEKGKISSAGVAFVSAADDVTVSGTVEGEYATLVTSERGGITVNGEVMSEGPDGMAFLQSGKDIRFTEKGSVRGADGVELVAQGDLIQDDAHLTYQNGRIEAVSLRPAASGKEVELTTGGDIGQGKSNPFVVDGKVYAVSLGDMSIAAGRGRSLEGGNASSKVSVEDSVRFARDLAQKKLSNTVTLEELQARMANPSDFDDNALLYASGSMCLYTAGQMNANSFVGAEGDMTVSAATFGDMSYLNAGGTLTINNVGKPAHPQVAYFESVDGKEPKINNQPNDVVIFVDGRLAGGNLQIINKFGATEAFPVATPELKSEQGIFGNPVFLHGDLDVANPMAVGNVDYMLQEIPRLTLASDFPLEIDKSVNTAGLNPKDVYRFGQHPQVAEEKPQLEQEKEKKDEKASAEKPAEPKVAMR